MQLLAAIATGYALGSFLGFLLLDDGGLYAGLGGVVVGLAAGLWAGLARPGRWISELAALVWLGALPAWGFWINHDLPSCTHACEGVYRALDGPGVWVVLGSWLVALAAYGLHARHGTPRHPGVEALLVAALGQGAVTCAVLTVHFFPASPMGLVLGPVGLPLVSPTVATGAFAFAVVGRLAALGRRDQAIASTTLAATLGVWQLLTWFSGPYLHAFTGTCGWTLSQMVPPEQDCHYLCTVAAQGSPTLVRPLRLGRRRGQVIVVNRQLAVANAFEDLLHERWPRFGRLARRVYDALARDVSRLLCLRGVANGIYVLMLPAQVGFELFLLAFDPGDPEERIDRMYR